MHNFWQAATEYVVRVSFGTALIASIVIVYTTIIAIVSSRRYFSNLMQMFLIYQILNHFDIQNAVVITSF